MKSITLPLSELKPALTGLGKVLNKRSTLPVLGMIKVERTKDGWIALTSTDLDAFATVRMEQPAEGEAVSLLVRYDDLHKVVKTCGKTDNISIRTDEKASDPSVILETTIGGQPILNRCTSLPVDEFPATPKIPGDAFALADGIRRSIHEAMECASEDESRLILNAAFIDVSQTACHTIVGTNGSHLYASNSFTLPLNESIILPFHAFLDFKEFNADGEWQIKTLTSPDDKDIKHVQIATRRWRFITKQHIGNYPNWRQVVPDKFETTIHLEDPEAVIQTVQRLPDHDTRFHAIGLALENGAVSLMAKSSGEDPWMNVAVNKATATGKDVKVFINREYLLKGLRFGLTRIDVIDHISPLRFSNDGRLMIVMPVRAEASAPVPVPAKPEPPKPGVEPETQPAPEPQSLPPPAAPNEPVEPATNNASPAGDITLDQCLDQVETLKETMQSNISSLTALKSKLKAIQREQKASVKEVQQVRATLKSLQGVKP